MDERPVWWPWVAWVTLGETVGFCVPAIVGAATARSGSGVTVPALVAAGAVEGAILGAAQAHVLRRILPRLSRRAWVTATAGAAMLAWLTGLTPSTWGPRVADWPPAALAAMAAALGTVLLMSLGTAQWLVLRRYAHRCGYWISGTALAWLAGLSVFMVIATPLWQPGQPPSLVLAIGVLAGAAMAATVAAVTGAAVTRLRTHHPDLH